LNAQYSPDFVDAGLLIAQETLCARTISPMSGGLSATNGDDPTNGGKNPTTD
jgi:hypothetical protein